MTTQPTPFVVSRSHLARLLGCKPDHVSRLITEGLPVVRTGGGRGRLTEIDLRQALPWLWTHHGPEAERARARKLMAQARVAEMQAARLEGSTIPIEQAVKENFECARVVRENVLNVTARVAAEFAAQTDAGKIAARLDAELRAALTAAADTLAS